MIRLSDFVLNTVMKRKIPNIGIPVKPVVLAKVDIEGSELEVLTDLLITGAMQHVDKFLVEFHPYFKACPIISSNKKIQNGLWNIFSDGAKWSNKSLRRCSWTNYKNLTQLEVQVSFMFNAKYFILEIKFFCRA